MNKRLKITFLVLVVSVQIFTISNFASAVITNKWIFPSQATPINENPEADITVFLDNNIFTNGSGMDWGDVEAGLSYTKILTVQNNADNPVIITVTTDNDFPEDWTLTYTLNGTTFASGVQLSSNLILTLPDPMTETEPQTWLTYVNVEPLLP